MHYKLRLLSYACNEGVCGHHRRHVRPLSTLSDEQPQHRDFQCGSSAAVQTGGRGCCPLPTDQHNGAPGGHQLPVQRAEAGQLARQEGHLEEDLKVCLAGREQLAADGRGALEDAQPCAEEHEAERLEDVLLHDAVELADLVGRVEAAGNPHVDIIHEVRQVADEVQRCLYNKKGGNGSENKA